MDARAADIHGAAPQTGERATRYCGPPLFLGLCSLGKRQGWHRPCRWQVQERQDLPAALHKPSYQTHGEVA